MSATIMRYFEHDHLTNNDLKHVSEEICELAEVLNAWIPDSAEKSAGLRKLLEAKDCFVRAALDGLNTV